MAERKRVEDNLVIENARIIFRNFAGEEKKYNDPGERNFCVVIENQDFANRLREDGWNVRILKPRDPDDEPLWYIPVDVNYRRRPPMVTMFSGKTKTQLNEDTISCLDYADIKELDVELRPYNWENARGETGVKAYLKSMYVTIVEDKLAAKYADRYADDEDEPF